MHNFEQIRKEIDTIEGGAFQALAQRCCLRKYRFKSAHYYGTKEGSVKTTKGRPDSFYETNAGGWAFLEAGHIADRSQAIAKMQADIQACLDYENQHPDMEHLDLIICCYSCSRLTPTDIDSLKKADPRVLLIGPDEVAEMCSIYPWLAYEYLGIEVESNQIYDLENFVALAEKDAFAPSLKLELSGRTQEIEDLLRILSTNQAVCLTGKSGSGKTKLAIETCIQYSISEKAEVLVIRPSRKSIYEALERCCSSDGKYLVLLDDSNDLADLKLVREYVSLHEKVKAIATVRNYAKQSVVNELRHIQMFAEYPVSPVTNEVIEDVIKNQMGIKNQNYIQQIIRATHGNIRLAILASESAKANGFQSIANIHDLLKVCYEKRLEKFSPDEKHAIAISSILGAHATKDNANLNALELRASIDHARYIAACKSLHCKELLDMIQNYSAVNFEEQNLRDYFIRQAIIEERVFKLKDIYSLPGGKNLVAKILNVILGVFYTDGVRDDLVDQILEIWIESDNINRFELIKGFGNLIPLESLAFLAAAIQSMDSNPERLDYLTVGLERKSHYGFRSNILECLATLLDNHKHWQVAVDLVFNLLEKENEYVEDYCYVFDSLLKPNRPFFNASIARERYVFDQLKTLHASTADTTYAILLLRYAKAILNDEIEGSEPGEGNQVTFYRGILPYSDELAILRKNCISTLFTLRQAPFLTKMADSIVFGYRGLSADGTPSLAAETCKTILDNYSLPGMPASYSCLQSLWSFRRAHKKVLLKFGWIDDLFNENYTTKLVSYLQELTWRPTASNDELKSEFQEFIAPMTDSDWDSFLDLLQNDQADGNGFDYHVPRILAWAIEYYGNRNTRTQELLLDAFLSMGVSPWYDFDLIFSSLESLHRPVNTRQVITGKVPSKLTASWLARYDVYILTQTNDYPTFATNVLNGLSEYGEVVDFDSVVATDMALPGFLGKYCNALTENTMVPPSQLCYYLAGINEAMISSLDASLNRTDNLTQVEELLCFLLANSTGYWHGEKLCICAIEKDPIFIKNFLRAWIVRDSEVHISFEQNIGEFYWKTPNPIEALALLPEIQKELPDEFSIDYHLKKCVSSIVKAGIDEGHRARLIEWLASEAVSQSPFSEVAIEASSSLSYEIRTDFCIVLCEKGASVETFAEASTSMPFDGVSWSGSEIPLIEKKIEYEENLAKLLLEMGYPEQCLELQKHLRRLRESKKGIELREFVSPF